VGTGDAGTGHVDTGDVGTGMGNDGRDDGANTGTWRRARIVGAAFMPPAVRIPHRCLARHVTPRVASRANA